MNSVLRKVWKTEILIWGTCSKGMRKITKNLSQVLGGHQARTRGLLNKTSNRILQTIM